MRGAVPLAALLLAIVLPIVGAGPAAAQETPMLMEGKTQLYQRVLIRDRVPALDAPGGAVIGQLTPLDPYFVYDRGDGHALIGRDTTGAGLVWVAEEALIDWRQNIVATFESTAAVERLLFLEDWDALYRIVESEAPEIEATTLRREAEAAEASGGSAAPVVALGPRETVDAAENFYVLPILDHEEAIFENGADVTLLKVGVVQRDGDADDAISDGEAVPDRDGAEASTAATDLRAAVVFVVDTTFSMEPYIRRTREVLSAMVDDLAGSEVGQAISFGAIGYRDSLAAAPELGYLANTYVELAPDQSARSVKEGLARMAQAERSSVNFREDSLAGIEHALRSLSWRDYGMRYLVLVTDASPREADDDLGATGLGAPGMGSLLREQHDTAAAVFHLLTEQGTSDHPRAEAAYRALTRQPNQAPLYFPIADGDADTYADAAGELARTIVAQVAAAREGDAVTTAEPGTISAAVQSVGEAMRLAWVGRERGVEAPDVFEAYVADRDFARTNLKPLSIRLLISKAQLSDLEAALTLIIEKAEENVITPRDFFDQVVAAAAAMSRRPEEVAASADATLADVAAIAEYLEGLPYRSRIMTITPSDWVRMSISEQQSLVNDLYDKVALYRGYNATTDQWVDVAGTGDGNAMVYPMPLDDLP